MMNSSQPYGSVPVKKSLTSNWLQLEKAEKHRTTWCSIRPRNRSSILDNLQQVRKGTN